LDDDHQVDGGQNETGSSDGGAGRKAAGRSRALPLSIPPIGPEPMTADERGHDGQAERLEGVAVHRVVSRLAFGHRWPRSVIGLPMPAAAAARGGVA
jgi:hypothetical protein